jgi:hypothetical protein
MSPRVRSIKNATDYDAVGLEPGFGLGEIKKEGLLGSLLFYLIISFSFIR